VASLYHQVHNIAYFPGLLPRLVGLLPYYNESILALYIDYSFFFLFASFLLPGVLHDIVIRCTHLKAQEDTVVITQGEKGDR
jgi:hypothetical protein